jgi:nucleotide-binding universal stress UspA family protein
MEAHTGKGSSDVSLPPHRILRPTDLSELSRIAVRFGLAWGRAFAAKAFVLPWRPGGSRAGGARSVFGSTAIRVMCHAPCPVLALPAQAG